MPLSNLLHLTLYELCIVELNLNGIKIKTNKISRNMELVLKKLQKYLTVLFSLQLMNGTTMKKFEKLVLAQSKVL